MPRSVISTAEPWDEHTALAGLLTGQLDVATVRAIAAHGAATKLEGFLLLHNIKPAHVARHSGYSRQHLYRVRMGRMQPTQRCMQAIVRAVRVLVKRKVRVTELFDVE